MDYLSHFFHTQARAKERVQQNTEVGRGLVTKMGQEATAPEMDKYSLHVEEVNMLLLLFLFLKQKHCQVEKITSLILGLSSRLAKTENTLATLKRGTWDEDEEVRKTLYLSQYIRLNMYVVGLADQEKRKTGRPA